MQSFKALLIDEVDGKVSSAFATLDDTRLDPGTVTIGVAYSSVNYKDALAATGAGKIIRRFPCVGGIDLSGTVIESTDSRFAAGDPVIATSFDIGVAHHGGYSEIARVPGDWVVPSRQGCRCLTPWRWERLASRRRWPSCGWRRTGWRRKTAR